MKAQVFFYRHLVILLLFFALGMNGQNIEWIKTFGDTGRTIYSDFFVTPAGTGMLITFNYAGERGYDYREIDLEKGNLISVNSYTLPLGYNAYIKDESGDFYFGQRDGSLVKMNHLDSTIIWQTKFPVYAAARVFGGDLVALLVNKFPKSIEVGIISQQTGEIIRQRTVLANGPIRGINIFGNVNGKAIISYTYPENFLGTFIDPLFSKEIRIFSHNSGVFCIDNDLSPRWCLPIKNSCENLSPRIDFKGEVYMLAKNCANAQFGMGESAKVCSSNDNDIVCKINISTGALDWLEEFPYQIYDNVDFYTNSNGRVEMQARMLKKSKWYDSIGDYFQAKCIFNPYGCEKMEMLRLDALDGQYDTHAAHDTKNNFYVTGSLYKPITHNSKVYQRGKDASVFLVKYSAIPNMATAGCGEKTVRLLPNPAHDEIELDLNRNLEHDFTIRIYDLSGRPITEFLNHSSRFIDISFLSAGIHVLELTENSGEVSRALFIKN